MDNLLFLVHRIPYPPNKGDKIRSFHFLKALSQHYNVFLGTFIDDPEDWQYIDSLAPYCQKIKVEAIDPIRSKIKSLKGLLTNQPLSLPYYQNHKMQAWVEQIIETHQITRILVFSSVMGQFILNHSGAKIVVDFVDVDSDKWLQYSKKKKWPENWIYRRESRQLLQFEKKLARKADYSLFVSEQEADVFKNLVPELTNKIVAVNNGVDTAYFTPSEQDANPYDSNDKVIVFTGAMDYWANIDAVRWFSNHVFPVIRQQQAHAKFYIVGSKPSREVLLLAENAGVIVTGRVDDIRPYIQYADGVVAPLRIARGIQNKVLEAMAMNKQIVATSAAIEGIPVKPGLQLIITDDAEKFAYHSVQMLQSSTQVVQADNVNREFVLKHFSWQSSTQILINLIG